jgi:hypothetical protein
VATTVRRASGAADVVRHAGVGLACGLSANVDFMAELARKTLVPIATGKRIFTRCGFKGILEKRAATILLRFDPDDGSVVD